MSDLKKYLSDGWTTDQLDNLVDVRVSNVDKKSLDHEPPVRLCNYMDVYSNDYITSNIDFMNATADKSQISKFVIKRGDVMITKDSETPDDIGIAAVSLEDFEDVVCGYHLALFKPYKDKICGEFLAKQLGQYEVNRQFANKANGSTRYGLTLNVIKTALIPFPVSIEKQKTIAHILTTCDTVIEQTQSTIAKYKAIKQGLLHDLFTRGLDAKGQLRPSYQNAPELYKESELGMIPKEWEVKIMDHLCDLITDGSHFSPTPLEVGEIIANVKDMGEFGINYEACTKISYKDFVTLKNQNCSPNKGDVLLSKDGTVGRVILFNDENYIVILSSIAILRPNNKLISEFLYGFLKSEYFNKQLLVKLSGSALKRIVLRDIKSLLVAFPLNQNEQQMMSGRIVKIENKIQIEETLLQKYQSIKRGLMGDLLGGKKEVTIK